uniref:inositol-trisphosphate 3-kinase B n=1 Tax=Solea senegalensis TaxID=28829 RepID=UPI001CD903F4|nr:inositol-trisphosphate 3-kinase B [Solea senegalensis]
MDVTDESRMETDKEKEQTMAHDSSDGLSEDMHQPVTSSEGLSSSYRGGRARTRPKLQWTKSFPPYSQCIGGLESGTSIPDQQHLRPAETMVDSNEVAQSTERKGDAALSTRCVRDERRAKWRMRRKERLGGSYEANTDRWEQGRWIGKRGVKETDGERGHDGNDEREGGTNSESNHWRSRNSSFETEMKEKGGEESKRSPVSVVEGENGAGRKTFAENDEEEAMELLPVRGGSTTHHQSSKHPFLSKLLHSSSSTSTSSCSSVNFSSAESDEVFSEGEDVGKRRETFRKYRSWKTFLTMMHWSLQRQSSWVQLAGHQGNFQLSERGEVLKLYSEGEAKCLDCLMRDPLRPFVPQYHGIITRGEQRYMRLEDLLKGLKRPVIMDCKMGVSGGGDLICFSHGSFNTKLTYQEEELVKAQIKATLRSDMYQKMVKIDPAALSEEEHAQRGVTKWRYLQWRDTSTSTSTLGFRIEGIMMEDGSVQRDLRKTLTLAQVTQALLYFTRSQMDILKAYHSRLVALNDTLMNSQFFGTHEVIGSSLLFVHDHSSSKANVWMIDFGKTTPVYETFKLRHNIPWTEGSREDGYLIGLSSLITSLSQGISMASCEQEDSGREERSVT